MTGLQFLSATIGQFVWPIFIIVFLVVMREPIKKLATNPRLKRFKAGPGGLEWELRDELDQAAKQLDQTATKQLESGSPAPDLGQKVEGEELALDFMAEMTRLADVQPRAVILESHVRLERLLRDSLDLDAVRGRQPRYLSMKTLTRMAVDQYLLAPNEAEVLDELTYIRNRVAHEPDEQISRRTAVRYAETAAQVAMSIRLARGETVVDGPAL